MSCAVANFGVWGTYFFKKNKAVLVTSARYMQMLQNFLRPKLRDFGENATVWFRQDGATAHIAKKINRCFARTLSGAFIFFRCDIGWPARSPSDYFLWSYVKAEVYKHQPTTIDGLKAAICQTENEILQKRTLRAMENLKCAYSSVSQLEIAILRTLFLKHILHKMTII